MNNKICFKCNVEQPIGEYYKHKRMGDGHLNKCKTCTKKDVKIREEELRNSSPEWVEKEKERAREKYKRLNYRGVHKPTSEAKKRFMAEYNSKYPEKKAARSGIGHLKCGKGNHLHHWSYNKEHFKDVIEMSIDDHYKLHRFMRYDQSAMMYKTMDGTPLDTREKHIEYLEKVKLL